MTLNCYQKRFARSNIEYVNVTWKPTKPTSGSVAHLVQLISHQRKTVFTKHSTMLKVFLSLFLLIICIITYGLLRVIAVYCWPPSCMPNRHDPKCKAAPLDALTKQIQILSTLLLVTIKTLSWITQYIPLTTKELNCSSFACCLFWFDQSFIFSCTLVSNFHIVIPPH